MSFTKYIVVVAISVLAIGCGGSGPKIAEKPVTNTKDQSARVAETVVSHTTEGTPKKPRANANTALPEPAPAGKKRKWSRSGDPIDTTKFDLAVTTAEKELKSKPEDAGAKKALAKAFFERGIALTSARQYAAAIGDYRRALKYDPSDADAKQQIGTITAIYNSMNIETPGVGEEPAPLEFKKEKD
jgi:tetratricopeptide (TPR) repeat protein